MIRKAYVKNDRYMPFGVNSVEVTSKGKNLYNPQKVVYGAYNNGFFDENSWRIIVIHVEPNTDITLSGFNNQNGAFSSYLNSSDYKDFNRNAWNTQSNNGTHKIPSDIEWVGICYYKSNDGADLQIEYGSGTEYQSPKESKAIINGEFAGIKVSSGGNYTDPNGQQWICDEIVKYADGSGEYIQRILKTVLDGSGTWVSNTTNTTDVYRKFYQDLQNVIAKNSGNSNVKECICTHYIANTPTKNFLNNESICIDGNGSVVIFDSNYTEKNLTSWKLHLAENPITCLFELETPIHTPLTAEEIAEIEKLHTFYPVTNISNDFDCGMSVKYVGEGIITTNTEIPVVAQDGEPESGDNIVTLFGKIKRMLENLNSRLSTLEQNSKTIVYSDTEPETVEENTIVMIYETEE